MERNRQVVEKKRGLKNLIWPPMETPRKAKLVRLPALFLTVFAAFLWSGIAVAGFFSEIHHWNLTVFFGNIMDTDSIGIVPDEEGSRYCRVYFLLYHPGRSLGELPRNS